MKVTIAFSVLSTFTNSTMNDPHVTRVYSKTKQMSGRLPAWCLLIGLLVSGILGNAPSSHGADDVREQIQAIIRDRLDGTWNFKPLACQGQMLCGIQMLPIAYRKRHHLPLWVDDPTCLKKAEVLSAAIERAGEDGLDPMDYYLDVIHELLAQVAEQLSAQAPVLPEVLADLDLILTDSFLLYGSHLAAGRVNPETLHTDWKVSPVAVDLLESLEIAVSTGNVDNALDHLRPAHSGYTALRQALAQFRTRAAAGGWPLVDIQKNLRPGDLNLFVPALRHRLMISNDVESGDLDSDPLLFSDALEMAVRRYQRRSGLKVDGIVGPDTLKMLNVSVYKRIRQVELNLERWRWLPHDLGSRYIMVNTADFNLKAVENGYSVLEMRVVVGRPARRSPVFSSNMTYLVVNPYWNVPTTIAVEDILPKVQEDDSYLVEHGIKVLLNWEADAPEIDPHSIDWHAYHAKRFPFRLRQEPGPYNALGRIKFMFPNQFAVYLHDTPNRLLFDRVQRDFSSGCIRVEAPVVLANFVLADYERWTTDALVRLMGNRKTRTLRLKTPIPVHILYMTAWVDKTGTIQFRDDIYDRDRDLDLALKQRRPFQPPDFVHQTTAPVLPTQFDGERQADQTINP